MRCNELTTNADTPVFFIRDAAKFPHFIHVRPRFPALRRRSSAPVDAKAKPADAPQGQGVRALPDSLCLTYTEGSMFWDYLGSNPESLYQVSAMETSDT